MHTVKLLAAVLVPALLLLLLLAGLLHLGGDAPGPAPWTARARPLRCRRWLPTIRV